MKEPIIEIKNLVKAYEGIRVLDDVSLSIEKGDIVGILGLSGAGKSTLVRCINGLEKFDSGEIYYQGEKATFNKEYLREISMIFQNFNLLEQRNVLKNVELAGELVKDKDTHQKALELLNLVGLKDKIKAYPSSLSGGQKQRVAIARALMSNPKVLLCDEATSALDAQTTHSILSFLKNLNEEYGLTIIIISHQISVIEEICNKVFVLDNAKIVERGETSEVFLSPKSSIAKKLIYADELNSSLNDEVMFKIIFEGEVDVPLVSKMIQDLNIVISINYAKSRTINNKIYGELIFKIAKDELIINKLRNYLDSKFIRYEEV